MTLNHFTARVEKIFFVNVSQIEKTSHSFHSHEEAKRTRTAPTNYGIAITAKVQRAVIQQKRCETTGETSTRIQAQQSIYRFVTFRESNAKAFLTACDHQKRIKL